MTQDFIDYLVHAGKLTQDDAALLKRWLQHSQQSIGMIALSHGLMTGPNIDEVLQRQSATRERFGEIAVKMASLTTQQVERLLAVQMFRRYAMTVEGACLAGLLSLADAAACFADFVQTQFTAEGALVAESI